MALGGTGYAAVTVTGKQIKDSSITGRDVKNKSLTKKDFKGSVRGPRGVTGTQGPKGDKGDKGDMGNAPLWAVIASDGTKAAPGRGVVSSERLGLGQYDVIFSQDVSACALTATPGGPSTAFEQPFASPYNANANGVFVEIKNSSDDRTDRNFNLTVAC